MSLSLRLTRATLRAAPCQPYRQHFCQPVAILRPPMCDIKLRVSAISTVLRRPYWSGGRERDRIAEKSQRKGKPQISEKNAEALRMLEKIEQDVAKKIHQDIVLKAKNGSISRKINIIFVLIVINVGVWAYEEYLKEECKLSRDTSKAENFKKSLALNLNQVLISGKWGTMLTSCFTHGGLGHLAMNMYSYWGLGQFLAYTPLLSVGNVIFLTLGSGLAGSAFYLWDRARRVKDIDGKDPQWAAGFSGCVMGVGATAACLYPTAKVHLFYFIPVQLWLVVTGYLAFDGYFLGDEQATGIAHGGHLGGTIFGLLFGFAMIRRKGKWTRKTIQRIQAAKI